MIRIRRVVLGLSVSLSLLGACGKEFEAKDLATSEAGASPSDGGSAVSAAGKGASAAGTATVNGESGAAENSAGDSSGGTLSGGAPGAGSSGAPALMAGGGSGGAPSAGSGGSGGLPGTAGGTVIEGDAGVPSPIPMLGMMLWLRADRGVTITSGHVSEWLDQSGNQMDALQTAGNARPSLKPTGLNGLPTLEFDGMVSYLRLPDGFDDFHNGLSGFMVARATVSGDACASAVQLSNGSEIDDIEFGYWKQSWHYEAYADDFSGGTLDSKQPQLYAILHRPTEEVVMRVNGNQANTATFPLPVTKLRQENFIGRSLYAGCDYYQGQISEIVLYNRIVSDKELLTIEGYLQQHWAL